MLSAFGVDHGEVSKARMPMRGMPGGRRPSGAQKRTAGQGGPSGPQKVAAKAKKITETDISLAGVGRAAGAGAKGIGGFFERRPGLTGTALVGGGGAAGYHALSQKEPKRKSR